MKIKWYLEYAWVKINIWMLTPIVWFENKWNDYKKARLEAYVKYQIAMNQIKK